MLLLARSAAISEFIYGPAAEGQVSDACLATVGRNTHIKAFDFRKTKTRFYNHLEVSSNPPTDSDVSVTQKEANPLK